jgi:NAD(P)-dependent dehydrogenase (short-subunit alcohol dehydrogenase family)
MTALHGKTALVVGASRGLGLGVAQAFRAAGASVVAVARSAPPAAERPDANGTITFMHADATDPVVAGTLLAVHQPHVLALVAGATPLLRPVQHHTWETFSRPWDVDVRITFHWLREALLLPLRPGTRVIVTGSMAEQVGSPLSGGYAGSKRTIRFLADYARQESQRGGLGIDVACVLPTLTPVTDIGRLSAAAYAAHFGETGEQFRQQLGEPLTPAVAGQAFVSLATGEVQPNGAYVLGSGGLTSLAVPAGAPPRAAAGFASRMNEQGAADADRG